MLRNSLPSLRAQIAKLEQKAEAMKRQVVSRLQREIQAHGLTAEDLFGGGFIAGPGRKSKLADAARGKTASVPKYGDGQGNFWGGMGKRPQWLKDRLEAGASLDEFLLASTEAASTKSATSARGKSSAKGAADSSLKSSASRKAVAERKSSGPRKRRKVASRETSAIG
jgi:DNA-binding protein H-NS